MLYIDKIPKQLQSIIDVSAAQVSKPQAEWLQLLMMAMAVCLCQRNVKALAALLDPDWARSSLNDFFTESPWVAPEVLRAATLKALLDLGLRQGERIEVILDGTPKAKWGLKMDALGWVKEAGTKEWRKGHRILLCYLRVRGVMFPWAVDLYLSEKFLKSEAGKALKDRLPDVHFRTLNEMAADMIRSLPASWATDFNVTALMDSGFCNPTACGAVREMGFHYIVAAQSTRVLVKNTRKGEKGMTVVLQRFAAGRIRYQGRDVILPGKRRGSRSRCFRVAETIGTLRGLGMVKVVCSRRESDGNILSLVSSDTEADARDVALAYGWRWEIEVTTKGLKGRLGLGRYQCRYYEGMVHHLHLSLLAHLVLTVAELQRRGQKALKQRAAHQLPSIRVLQIRLRHEIWQGILAELRPTCTDTRILDRLERALEAAS